MSIRDLIEQDLGPPARRGARPAWVCPFHADKDPSLVITPDGEHYKCFGCLQSGDDIDWLRKVRKMSFADAYRLARGVDAPQQQYRRKRAARPRREPVKRQPKPAPPVAWQEQARVFVEHCQGELFGDAGRMALDWLHARGLRDETIRQWGLGWHRRDRWRIPSKWGLSGGKKVWLPRGVVIPWVVGGAVEYVKARRFGAGGPLAGAGEKYAQVRDGRPTLYGLDLVTGKRAAAICEGELDAVLLWQEAGDLVDVVAVGSKGATVEIPFLARLLRASVWLLALDADADERAQIWASYAARARRVRPPRENDLTEAYQAGVDLRTWIKSHIGQTKGGAANEWQNGQLAKSASRSRQGGER